MERAQGPPRGYSKKVMYVERASPGWPSLVSGKLGMGARDFF